MLKCYYTVVYEISVTRDMYGGANCSQATPAGKFAQSRA